MQLSKIAPQQEAIEPGQRLQVSAAMPFKKDSKLVKITQVSSSCMGREVSFIRYICGETVYQLLHHWLRLSIVRIQHGGSEKKL
jgi:hypothetical protein